MSGQIVKKADQRLTVRGWFEQQKNEIARAVPRHIDPERLVRVALTACVQNPKLLNCTRESLMQATLQSASLGLMPDGVMGQSYLIPYGDKAQFQIGYQGLIELAIRTDRIAAIIADVVHAKDKFEFWREVEKDHFIHRPYEGDEDPGPVSHVYAIIRRKDGTSSVTVLPKNVVEREHRAHSRSANNGPWTSHWSAMAKKTAILVALKYEAKSTELAKAVAVEERTEQGIEVPPDESVLDAQVLPSEPKRSALDEIVGDGEAPPDEPAPAELKLTPSPRLCFGCDQPIKTEKERIDKGGQSFHKECLAVVEKATK